MKKQQKKEETKQVRILKSDYDKITVSAAKEGVYIYEYIQLLLKHKCT